MEGLLRSLRAARDFRPEAFLPVTLGGESIGWVRREHVGKLAAWPDVFGIESGAILLRPAGNPALSAAFARVAKELERAGLVRGWRGETFAIRTQAGAMLFHVERAAVRFFGFTSAASHLHGYSGERVLIARRAATKAIEPGMLDNLVAGGVPSAEDAWQTLMRECGEEAGIPGELSSQARPAGVLHVCRDTAEGLNSELLNVYDLGLPAEFEPRNHDGEVGEFLKLNSHEMVERIARGEMTLAAGLVAVDCELRRGTLADPGGKLRAAIEACRA